MTEQTPSPLRLRSGGSVVLPEGSTETDIDNAGRATEAEPATDEASDAASAQQTQEKS